MVIYEKSKYFSAETEGDSRRGLSPFIIRALRARGAVTDEEIEAFMYPKKTQLYDPFLFNDMDKAVKRIRKALARGERICVFGDYDVDGICATAMLTDYLRSVCGNVCLHIPSRRDEGYGITKPAVDKLKAEGVQLIVTVDNGISAAPEVAYCTQIGIDVIITDHHLPPAEMPECTAVICHTLKNSRYPGQILCGAGIAFKLIQALAGLDAAMKYVSLTALATVADVVPLVDENRVLTLYGLEAVNSDNCCLGLKRLLESIPTVKKPYDSLTFGFAAAPRLNASGRMKEASFAAELFLSNDENKINGIIKELSELNELRQLEESSILNNAVELLKQRDLTDTRAIILKSSDWNQGVIGIAASRLSEIYYRPTILFSESDGFLKGSGRSVEGINLYDALAANAGFCLRYGGHAKAAGVTMKAEKFDEFRASFNEYLKRTYSDEVFVPRMNYEFETELCDVTKKLVSEFSRLAPFGEGNPFPVFRTRGVRASRIRRFGIDGRHMRIDFEKSGSAREAVWFSAFENFEKVVNADSADILYTVDMSRWNGTEKLQLRLKCVNSEIPEDSESYVEGRMADFLSSFIENCICIENAGNTVNTGSAESTESTESTENTGSTEKRGNPYKFIEKTTVDFEAIAGECLLRTLILVNTPSAAVRLLKKIRNKGGFEVHTGEVPESQFPGAAVLLAPVISRLPAHGFAKVVCYDLPPAQEDLLFIKKRMQAAKLILNSDASDDYSALVSQLDCSRELFSKCYKLMYGLLLKRGHSFAELVKKLRKEANIIKAQAEFAVRVFFELNFIIENKSGSLVNNPNLHTNPLTNSLLYKRICMLKSEYGD